MDQIQRLVQERDSGFGLPGDLTPLEKELVLTWDDAVAAYRRAHEARVNSLFEMLAGMTTK